MTDDRACLRVLGAMDFVRWNGGVLKGIRRTLFSSKVIFRVQGLCCCDSVADGRGYVVEIGVE